MNKIRKNIYLGDKNDATEKGLKGSPITAILNVAVELNDPKIDKIVNVKVGMDDNASAAHRRTDIAVEALNRLLSQGHVVLVHCRMGRSRSPHIIAECLSGRENKDYFEIYKEIRKLRPQVMAYSMGQEIVDKYHRKELR